MIKKRLLNPNNSYKPLRHNLLMSLEITTTDPKITIDSLASMGKYLLSSHKKGGGMLAEREIPNEEYGEIIKNLWIGFLEKGEDPRLLEQPLDNAGFIGETLHYIAPDGFYSNPEFILEEQRENLVYWLMSNLGPIQEIFAPHEVSYLREGLEVILTRHIKRKQEATSTQ